MRRLIITPQTNNETQHTIELTYNSVYKKLKIELPVKRYAQGFFVTHPRYGNAIYGVVKMCTARLEK